MPLKTATENLDYVFVTNTLFKSQSLIVTRQKNRIELLVTRLGTAIVLTSSFEALICRNKILGGEKTAEVEDTTPPSQDKVDSTSCFAENQVNMEDPAGMVTNVIWKFLLRIETLILHLMQADFLPKMFQFLCKFIKDWILFQAKRGHLQPDAWLQFFEWHLQIYPDVWRFLGGH